MKKTLAILLAMGTAALAGTTNVGTATWNANQINGYTSEDVINHTGNSDLTLSGGPGGAVPHNLTGDPTSTLKAQLNLTQNNSNVKIQEGVITLQKVNYNPDLEYVLGFKNGKDLTIESLTGGAGSTVRFRRENGDGGSINFTNLTGANSFSGTIAMAHAGTGSNTGTNYLVLSNSDAVSNANLKFEQASGNGKSIVQLNVAEASVKSLSGVNGNIQLCNLAGNNGVTAATLTITQGSEASFSGEIGAGVTLVVAEGASQKFGNVTMTSPKLVVNGTMTIEQQSGTTYAADSLTLAGGATFTLGSESDHSGRKLTATVLTVNATNAAATTLNADLDLNSTTKLTMNGVLTLGCDLDLGKGDVELAGSLLQQLLDSEGSSAITLFNGVDTMKGSTNPSQMSAASVFSNRELVDSEGITYTVTYANEQVSLVKTVSDPAVPEPATGSLSLLALAGLCARRRRK
ncbi:MAG: PEP-CTERM sorting domain-containing protein [Akkermansia sp.]|nr:PEP-CTERM sorting domain-containing protein [Akkermansia sp.]